MVRRPAIIWFGRVVSFWPSSLFIVPGLVWGWRLRRTPASRFLLAWLGPAWIFFELVPTKLPHYVLTLYPALALLAGGALARGFAEFSWARRGLSIAPSGSLGSGYPCVSEPR